MELENVKSSLELMNTLKKTAKLNINTEGVDISPGFKTLKQWIWIKCIFQKTEFEIKSFYKPFFL